MSDANPTSWELFVKARARLLAELDLMGVEIDDILDLVNVQEGEAIQIAQDFIKEVSAGKSIEDTDATPSYKNIL